MLDKQDGDYGVGKLKGDIGDNTVFAGVYNDNCKSDVKKDLQSNGHIVNVYGDGHNINFNSKHESKCKSPSPAKELIDDKANIYEAMIVLTGKLCANDLVEFEGKKVEIKTIVAHLKKRYDIDLTIKNVSEGSIKIELSGSQEDIEKLKTLFESKELRKILDIPVQDVQCKNLPNADNDVTKKKSKLSFKKFLTQLSGNHKTNVFESVQYQSGQFGVGSEMKGGIGDNARVFGVSNESYNNIIFNSGGKSTTTSSIITIAAVLSLILAVISIAVSVPISENTGPPMPEPPSDEKAKIETRKDDPPPHNKPVEPPAGVNYSKLRDLLAEKDWQKADEETWRVMLQVAGREKENSLVVKDIDSFPCDDLHTIDGFWAKNSDGRFGFSVQKDIYQELGGTEEHDPEIWRAFGDRVGWGQGGNLLSDDKLNWAENLPEVSPTGYLPHHAIFLMEGRNFGERTSSFAQKLVECSK